MSELRHGECTEPTQVCTWATMVVLIKWPTWFVTGFHGCATN